MDVSGHGSFKDASLPPTVTAELLAGLRRHPNAGVSFGSSSKKKCQTSAFLGRRGDSFLAKSQYLLAGPSNGGVLAVRLALIDADALESAVDDVAAHSEKNAEVISVSLSLGGLARVVLGGASAAGPSAQILGGRMECSVSIANDPSPSRSSFLPFFDHEIGPLLGPARAGHMRLALAAVEANVYGLGPRVVNTGSSPEGWNSPLPPPRHPHSLTIVETGTSSTKGAWRQAGLATLIFDKFANFHAAFDDHGSDALLGPSVFSVDLDAAKCDASRSLVSNRTVVTTSDSVKFLWNFPPVSQTPSSNTGPNNIDPVLRWGPARQTYADLIYLDSYDVTDWETPGADAASLAHHMKELAAALAAGLIARGHTIVVVDDCPPALELSTTASASQAALRGKGGLIFEFMNDVGCLLLFSGYQAGWVC